MKRLMAAMVTATVLCGAPAAGAVDGARKSKLEQFASRGDVLGFDSDGYYVSNGTYALRVHFVDAQPVAPIADGAASGSSDEKAPPLSRIDYPELWPGIRVTYDAPSGGIARSTWTLQPGADPSAIRLRYNQAVTIAEDGSLGVGLETGRMNESRPVAWQDVDGIRQPVDVAFAQLDEDCVGFRLGAYRRDLELIIDPTLSWSTFLGHPEGRDDSAQDIVVDSGGNVYVLGASDGPWGSPIIPFSGEHDAYVAKLSAGGG